MPLAFSLVTALPALQYKYTFPNGWTFYFDQNTAPGWISCLLALGGLLLLTKFQNVPKPTSDDPKKNVLAQSSSTLLGLSCMWWRIEGVTLSVRMRGKD